ncbi:MAG: sigma-70 family RNA polymerase sigma factor [Candidatus Omnitrophica bacterium]|nr:sigma-70 family RNA polymerase sigma factor [Candidatus Omnitrophota bacterium]MBU1995702.1 sigma-70 family RNA polymerase sigma factor [Candidatus Omnitrophota bacterium]
MVEFLFRENNIEQYLDDPDAKLMLKFKEEEDPSAFEELMRKNFSRIMNFIYRFVADRELAEDLTQEVFIKIYNSASNYYPRSKFKTWAFTIARNISLNELRKNKGQVVSLDKPFKHGEDDMSLQVEDKTVSKPDDEIIKEELVDAVGKAINELPANQRTAILLIRYEGFSYEEIARTMNTTVSAVKSLLSRARETLKEKLADIVSG